MSAQPMTRHLLGGLFWVFLANLIVKPLWLLGVEVGVQNAVGNEMYGLYASVFNLAYIFNILLDLGLTNYTTRHISQHPTRASEHLSSILVLKVALLGLYLLATFGVGALLGYRSAEFHLLLWLCVAQFLNSMLLFVRSHFEGLLLFRWDSLFSVMDRLLMVVICGLLLWTPARSHFTLRYFVYAQVVAYAVSLALALVVIIRHVPLRALRWDASFFRAVLRSSLPFALLVLLMASYNRLDPILLRRLDSAAAAGVYAGAFRLLDALTMIAYLVSVPLLPVFSRQCADADHGGIAQSVRMVFPPLMSFALGAAITLAVLAEPLMQLFYPSQSPLYAPVFCRLVFGLVPIGITYVFGTLLTADGRLRQLNLFAATSLLMNILLNVLLIPRWGAVGSAWASLSTQSLMALCQLCLACRLFHLPLSALCLPRLLLFVVAVLAANLACSLLGVPFVWHLVLAIAIAVGALFGLRLVDVREIMLLLRPAGAKES